MNRLVHYLKKKERGRTQLLIGALPQKAVGWAIAVPLMEIEDDADAAKGGSRTICPSTMTATLQRGTPQASRSLREIECDEKDRVSGKDRWEVAGCARESSNVKNMLLYIIFSPYVLIELLDKGFRIRSF